MFPRTTMRLHHTIAGVLLALMPCGCGEGRHAGWRTYREVILERPEPALALPPPTSAPAGGSVRWTTPEGWTEEPGSGMRLVTFHMGAGRAAGLCTVVQLAGDAGGLEANIRRWMGQLQVAPPEPEAFRSFVDAQERFTTDSGWRGTLVDLTSLAGSNAQASSMLACLLDTGEATVFAKITGPADVLKAEASRFRGLCQSLRTE